MAWAKHQGKILPPGDHRIVHLELPVVRLRLRAGCLLAETGAPRTIRFAGEHGNGNVRSVHSRCTCRAREVPVTIIRPRLSPSRGRAMAAVTTWTGREANALRRALRMSVTGFAEHLGAARRTVAKWSSQGDEAHLRADVQAALDTVLARATPDVREHFEALVRAGTSSALADPATLSVTDTHTILAKAALRDFDSDGDERRRDLLTGVTIGGIALPESQPCSKHWSHHDLEHRASWAYLPAICSKCGLRENRLPGVPLRASSRRLVTLLPPWNQLVRTPRRAADARSPWPATSITSSAACCSRSATKAWPWSPPNAAPVPLRSVRTRWRWLRVPGS